MVLPTAAQPRRPQRQGSFHVGMHWRERIGGHVSEKFRYILELFEVERHLRGRWVCRLCESMTLRAPWISSVLKCGSPRLLMLSTFTRPSVPDWRKTSPRKAKKTPARSGSCVHRPRWPPLPWPAADPPQGS